MSVETRLVDHGLSPEIRTPLSTQFNWSKSMNAVCQITANWGLSVVTLVVERKQR